MLSFLFALLLRKAAFRIIPFCDFSPRPLTLAQPFVARALKVSLLNLDEFFNFC